MENVMQPTRTSRKTLKPDCAERLVSGLSQRFICRFGSVHRNLTSRAVPHDRGHSALLHKVEFGTVDGEVARALP